MAHLGWYSRQHGEQRARVGKIFRVVSACQQKGGGELWASKGRRDVNDERRDLGWRRAGAEALGRMATPRYPGTTAADPGLRRCIIGNAVFRGRCLLFYCQHRCRRIAAVPCDFTAARRRLVGPLFRRASPSANANDRRRAPPPRPTRDGEPRRRAPCQDTQLKDHFPILMNFESCMDIPSLTSRVPLHRPIGPQHRTDAPHRKSRLPTPPSPAFP